jgi:hypothetical protein
MNHPIGGPVFSGPHQQPFVCQTEFSGLERAVDADCNAPTRVEYFYRSTRKLTSEEAQRQLQGGELGPGYLPLNPSAEMPRDVAVTTTTDGTRLKFIVRVETGTINRGVYRIAFLHQPGQPLPDPWASTPGWNGRLVYSFGGGCGTGFRQGQTPAPLDLGSVGAGYAVAGSTLDVYGTLFRFQSACGDAQSDAFLAGAIQSSGCSGRFSVEAGTRAAARLGPGLYMP